VQFEDVIFNLAAKQRGADVYGAEEVRVGTFRNERGVCVRAHYPHGRNVTSSHGAAQCRPSACT
jgi:hypothetical protein